MRYCCGNGSWSFLYTTRCINPVKWNYLYSVLFVFVFLWHQYHTIAGKTNTFSLRTKFLFKVCFLVQSRPNPILSILPNGKCFHQWFNKISNLDLLLPQFQLFTLVIFLFRFYYSCNKITKTWIQISRQNWNGFF